jgi:hypothetical protein
MMAKTPFLGNDLSNAVIVENRGVQHLVPKQDEKLFKACCSIVNGWTDSGFLTPGDLRGRKREKSKYKRKR